MSSRAARLGACSLRSGVGWVRLQACGVGERDGAHTSTCPQGTKRVPLPVVTAAPW